MCKAISAIKTLRRRWIVRSNVLSDELKGDEDLHNKLKSSDQANISDEQEFNTENKHFRGKCKGDTSHKRVWHVGEGHRSKQVRVYRCYRGTSEYFSQYASQSGEVLLQDIQQLLEEMNSDITASEATELEHKKTFEELSDTKNEEIAANIQQHKEKSLEAQETKLSHDRKNWKGPRSTLMSRRLFLRISTQLEARDHFSKTKQTGIRSTCKAFPPLGRGIASGVWLERRAELERSIVELNSTRTTA